MVEHVTDVADRIAAREALDQPCVVPAGRDRILAKQREQAIVGVLADARRTSSPSGIGRLGYWKMRRG
jgi:hypothetical protein